MSKRKREAVEEVPDETESISVNAYQTLVGTISKTRLPKRRRREPKSLGGNQQVYDNVTVDDNDQLENNSDHEVEEYDGSHDEDDVTGNSKDPFSLHVSFDVEPYLPELDKNIATTSFQYHNDTVLGKVGIVSWLSDVDGLPCHQLKGNSLLDSHVKQKMCKTWTSVNKKLSRAHDQQLTPLQAKLFAILNNYQDLLYTNRTFENCEEIRNIYLLHALNHVLKTRSRVLKHNSRLLRASQEGKELSVELRDQGLTRPKVLILLPFRESALCVVNTISKLLIEEGQGQVRYRKRFQEEYGPVSTEKEPTNKPDSWYKIFAGNVDDCFRMGIAVTSKQLKLFSEFYRSDILVASPLGLRTIIGGEGDKSQDYDYLSSLEVVICDQLDVMLMQNWEHVQTLSSDIILSLDSKGLDFGQPISDAKLHNPLNIHIFEHMHAQPRESHDVDFSRVRMWCINGHSKYYRQTLLFSSFPAAELNSLFNGHCFIKISVPDYKGSICQVTSHIPQTFRRVDCSAYSELSDVRFKFFIEEILPHHSSPLMAQTAIFIASYPDFVRLRNYMSREEKSFTQICEYTKQSDITRARSNFFHSKKHFILLTERMYYFHRLRIRGIHHIIFYSMPHNADFYSEILNNIELQDTLSPMCTVLYSKYEALQLARVVGSRRAQVMCQSHETLHMMVTGSQ